MAQVIEGVDVTSDDSMAALVKELTAGTVGTIDVLVSLSRISILVMYNGN